MPLLKLNIKATVPSRGEAATYLRSPGDAVLVERGIPRWLVMSCPCGCGEQIPINLDPRSGPAWEHYGKVDRLTVFPSVWRDTGCKSHFIVWYGQILLFGPGLESEEWPPPLKDFEALTGSVRNILTKDLVHFRELARALNVIPWDVQHVCHQLVKAGYAREGTGKQRGFFGLRGPRIGL